MGAWAGAACTPSLSLPRELFPRPLDPFSGVREWVRRCSLQGHEAQG